MESATQQLELLKERISYDVDIFKNNTIYEQVLTNLLEDSKYIALSLKFPFEDYSDMELPKKYYNWQLRCSQEIYEGIGTANIVSYSENGVSWTRDIGNISSSLKNEITSKVGVIRNVSD